MRFLLYDLQWTNCKHAMGDDNGQGFPSNG
jgi:hypothetical protein